MDIDSFENSLEEFFRPFKLVEHEFETTFKNEIGDFCEAFLERVQEEIIARDVIDTGALFDSFEKGGKDNVWIESDNGLTIEVGSENTYAAAVNNGHKTCPPGVSQRWVPGRWEGKKFIYDPNAKTGMLLKQQWIDARPFFDSVKDSAEELYDKLTNDKFEEFIEFTFNN